MLPPFNPFLKFEARTVALLKKFNQVYVVMQTFTRNPGEEKKKQLLLCEYDDVGIALQHMRAIKNDKNAKLLDLNNEMDLKKVMKAIELADKYDLWWGKFKDRKEVDKRMNRLYNKNIMRWISQHTSWRIPRTYNMEPSTELIFGELVVVLKYYKQPPQRVNLTEIENT